MLDLCSKFGLTLIRTTVLIAVIGWTAPAFGIPVINEAGWTLLRTDTVPDAQSAHFNPIDEKLYVVRTTDIPSGGGLYRIEDNGSLFLVQESHRPRAVVVDPNDGDIFYAETQPGIIYRSTVGVTGSTLWVQGFHPGDDDPLGMAIAPDGFTGYGGDGGIALVADEGNNGPSHIWSWSPDTPEGESRVLGNLAGLIKPLDITYGDNDVFFVDQLLSAVLKIDIAGDASQITLSSPIAEPFGIAADPLTGDLFVQDSDSDTVVRIDPLSGAVSVVFSGFTFGMSDAASIDVSPSGDRMFVTERDSGSVYTFGQLGIVPEPGTLLLVASGLVVIGRSRRSRHL